MILACKTVDKLFW